MLNFGNKEIDEFVCCKKPELLSIYGPAGSGKTTLCLMATAALANKGKKIVFVDTENGFNVERLNQIAGWNYLRILDKILLLKVKNFEDQCKKIEQLKNLVNIDLVIVDTLSYFYREELKKNPQEVNKEMDKQLKTLIELTRKGVFVVMCNQVYTNINDSSINIVGGDMIKNWSKRLLKLTKEPRSLVLEKPELKEIKIDIANEGILKI